MNLSALSGNPTPVSTGVFANGTALHSARGHRELGDPGGGGGVASLKRNIESIETKPSVNEQSVVTHQIAPIPHFCSSERWQMGAFSV